LIRITGPSYSGEALVSRNGVGVFYNPAIKPGDNVLIKITDPRF